MSPQGYENMDLESQDPISNANLGQDEKLIWTKKLRCSHSMTMTLVLSPILLVVVMAGVGTGVRWCGGALT